MNKEQMTLVDAALEVLGTANAQEKAHKTRTFTNLWRSGDMTGLGHATHIPDRPQRPDKPELLLPRDMPKRKKGNNVKNRITLLHALAHIELNAVDLAWDMIARFSYLNAVMPASGRTQVDQDDFRLPILFYEDWLKVADDEAKHFLLLSDRLNDFGATYGDLPAHDGLWESAYKTRESLPARLAVVPMVLEARGLDVTPGMIAMMNEQDDHETAGILQIIHDDEVTHVEVGTRWFKKWCEYYKEDEETLFQELVITYFHANLKKPFNYPSRDKAGMIRDWYEPLADEDFMREFLK